MITKSGACQHYQGTFHLLELPGYVITGASERFAAPLDLSHILTQVELIGSIECRHGFRASRRAEKVEDPEGRKAALKLNEIAISPDEIGRAVVYAPNQPANVTVNDLIISPTQQDW